MVYNIKCFFEVTKHSTNFFFKFKAPITSFIKLKVAATVDEFVLKPNCSSSDKLLLLNVGTLLYIKPSQKP